MEQVEYVDPVTGRKYQALQNGTGMRIILGPPEELVERLNLPEPFATNLHNALYARGLFKYQDITRGNALQGALQEALQIDVQRLSEMYYQLQNQNQEVSP